MSEISLQPDGAPARHSLYALQRFRSRHANPLEEYSFSRSVPRSRTARLTPSGGRRTFNTASGIQPVPLLANPDVAHVLRVLFNTVGHEDFISINTRGIASQFDSAYHVFDVLVDALAPGTTEILTTIYCNAVDDLRLHSVFRVGT